MKGKPMPGKEVELYRKHRPPTLEDVVGQDRTVAALRSMVDSRKVPHAILFSGASGTGKTTLARILVGELGCKGGKFGDFVEVNASDSRGIDTVREIRLRIGSSPVGKARVWLLDEAHKLTGDAQTALLKLLEDPPDTAYIFIATTEPEKLLKTIRTRCTRFDLSPLSDGDMNKLINSILEKEGTELPQSVGDRIVEVAGGSARQALVDLGRVLHLEGEEEQLAAVQPSGVRKAAFDLVKALCWEKVKWADVAKIITDVEGEDPEGIRHLVLKVAGDRALKGNERAFAVLEAFECNFYDSKRAGLIMACRRVIGG